MTMSGRDHFAAKLAVLKRRACWLPALRKTAQRPDGCRGAVIMLTCKVRCCHCYFSHLILLEPIELLLPCHWPSCAAGRVFSLFRFGGTKVIGTPCGRGGGSVTPSTCSPSRSGAAL